MTEILGIVMERKLYGQYCKTLNQETQDEMMALLQNAPDDTTVMQQYIDTNPAFDEHLKQYELYFNSVMGGALGPTAQYWAIYIFMVNRIHRELMRALRTNDVNSYISILPAVIDIFFEFNRPNYARCGVLFLQKLSTTSPQTRSVLEKGAFSIRKTKKNYSRSAIDLTLEQTVNRDAASPMRGIIGFQNSENAVRRWCITSTERGKQWQSYDNLQAWGSKIYQPLNYVRIESVKTMSTLMHWWKRWPKHATHSLPLHQLQIICWI